MIFESFHYKCLLTGSVSFKRGRKWNIQCLSEDGKMSQPVILTVQLWHKSWKRGPLFITYHADCILRNSPCTQKIGTGGNRNIKEGARDMKPKAVHWHCQSWVCRRKERYWEILSSFLLKNKYFVLFFCRLDFELLSIHPELNLALGQVWRKTRSFRHMPHHSSILKMLYQGWCDIWTQVSLLSAALSWSNYHFSCGFFHK